MLEENNAVENSDVDETKDRSEEEILCLLVQAELSERIAFICGALNLQAHYAIEDGVHLLVFPSKDDDLHYISFECQQVLNNFLENVVYMIMNARDQQRGL